MRWFQIVFLAAAVLSFLTDPRIWAATGDTTNQANVVTSCGSASYTASTSTKFYYAPFTMDVTGKACLH